MSGAADWKQKCAAQAEQLAAKDAEIAELRALVDESSELLTIAHMDGYHKGQKACTEHATNVKIGEQIIEKEVWKRRAEAAEAERDYQISQRWVNQAAREKAEAALLRSQQEHQQDRRCMAERIGELEAELASWRDALMCVEDGATVTGGGGGGRPSVWTMMPESMASDMGDKIERADARVKELEGWEKAIRLSHKHFGKPCPGEVGLCPEHKPEPGCILTRDIANCWLQSALRGEEASK